MSKNNTEKLDRRKLLSSMLIGGLTLPVISSSDESLTLDDSNKNSLLWAVAWQETAAEYGALCHQAYNLARFRVEQALSNKASQSKPLAVITDMDNTLIGASSYWGYLINNGMDFFDDAIWDQWVPENNITAIPGSKDFLNYCHANNVEVFYVTNRNQGEETYQYALDQLHYLEFPYADTDHLTVYRDSSNKTPIKEAIDSTHDLVVMLGDNLNDYKRDYYVDGIDLRYQLMERDKKEFGDKFILLPNPTDGHWVRAIFGDSEPLPTESNRNILKAAATRRAWAGRQ